ncbi:hypothetical protein GCM10008023_29070 [Sphingomonas glacialis]|uniref:Uncharacterized protein n=1 Tax=Sphingomonas glacialis TaxID=658225 RepID=A0ABQ3LMG6_9SPHN|nr:hypothetical protein [Sphingomonas glacialis]GHH20777.1 hypothetical protein GCM10008023_29070 [Sphingomonas glacialis]
MKITHLIAAGLMIAGIGVSTTAASAQGHRDDRRYEQRGDRGFGHHGDRGDRNWRGDRGRHNGWNTHRRCRTEWRHHRRMTVCR